MTGAPLVLEPAWDACWLAPRSSRAWSVSLWWWLRLLVAAPRQPLLSGAGAAQNSRACRRPILARERLVWSCVGVAFHTRSVEVSRRLESIREADHRPELPMGGRMVARRRRVTVKEASLALLEAPGGFLG